MQSALADIQQKREQIYFLDLRGLPCPLNSICLPTLTSISSTNRSPPVNWPRCIACRICSNSSSGIVPITNSLYFSCRSVFTDAKLTIKGVKIQQYLFCQSNFFSITRPSVIFRNWNDPSPDRIQLYIPTARKQVFVCAYSK